MPIIVTPITPPDDEDDETPPTLEEAAAQPKSMTVDGQSRTSHSLAELMELDRYRASQEALARRGLGIRRVKLNPPGAV